MKTLKLFIGAVLFLAATNITFAQLNSDDTGSRSPNSINRNVELFLGAHYKVVSFNGVAATTKITGGRGVLLGYDLVSASNGGVITTLEQIKVYDLASTSGLILASTSKGGVLADTSKIIPDVILGPVLPAGAPASIGGTFAAASQANVRAKEFKHPVAFENGVVIDYPANANHGAIGIYWKK